MEILKSDLDYIVPPHELDSDRMLNRLIENQILYQEAKARGLDVSYEKAEDYAKKVQEIQQQIRSGEVSVLDIEEFNQTQDIIKKYIDGMGVTEDEYWIMTVPIYQKALSIGNLRAEIISSVQNGDYHKDPYEHLKQGIQDIKKQYKIEIRIGQRWGATRAACEVGRVVILKGTAFFEAFDYDNIPIIF